MYKKYCEITNSYNTKILDKIKDLGYTGKWYVSEKINGTNVAAYYGMDGSVSYSSRELPLGENDNFYNYREVFAKINPNIDRLRENVKKVLGDDYPIFHTIVTYGELFGGNYPHPDVTKVKGAKKCQKGVYYTPDNNYLVFDVAVLRDWKEDEIDWLNSKIKEFKDRKSAATEPGEISNLDSAIKGYETLLTQPAIKYLDYKDFAAVLDGTNFRTVPLYGIYDSLDEALSLNEVFESKVSDMFGLPKIEENNAEGLVIRPVTEITFRNRDRVILKKKNERFLENNGHHNKEEKVDPLETSSDATKMLVEKAEEYSNLNRLNAVLSKIPGPFSDKDFGKILFKLNEDLLKDLEKDFPDEVAECRNKDEYKKVLTKKASQFNSLVLRKEFQNIITEVDC